MRLKNLSNKLKKSTLFFPFFFAIIFSNCPAASAVNTSFTITLQFDHIENPPKTLIPVKIIKRPTIGIALSGGGARGFAQIGVLKVLEKNNIPIDIIVGASMGSIVGGLYAAGYSALEIEKIAYDVEWQNIMSDKPPRTNLFIGQKEERARAFLQIRFKGRKIEIPKAITPGQRLISLLTNLTIGADFQSDSDFDKLRIPFRAVACDLLTGKEVLLNRGNLAVAMKASSAIPLLFEPVSLNGALLADGGLVSNIPVEEVAQFNVDLIIAIDTTSELNEGKELNVPWKIADQVTTIMQQEKNRLQRRKADLLIKPELDSFKSDNFKNVQDLIAAGEAAALEKIDDLKRLISQKETYQQDEVAYAKIDVEIAAFDSKIDSIVNLIIKRKELKNKSDIYQLLKQIYSSGFFQDVKANCFQKNDTLRVKIITEVNPAINHICFINNEVFSDSILKSIVKIKPGFPINHFQGEKDIRNLQKFYRSKGYSFMTITNVRVKHDTLSIYIDEGKIAAINVRGNKTTKDFVILREFPLKPKSIFNINKIKEGLDNINSTNLFKTVFIDVEKNASNEAIINIKIEEKAFSVLRFSYRYNLERKNKALFEITQENFLGFGNPITFQFHYGARDRHLSFNYRSDRILNTFLTNSVKAYLQQSKYYVYNNGEKIGEYRLDEKAINFSIGQQIEKLGMFSVIASGKKVEIKSMFGTGYPTGTYDIKNIELRSIVDTQDHYPFPNFGKYYLFQYKVSSATILNSQISYFKLFSSLDYFHTFWKRNTFHIKTLWGTSDLSAPFFEFFHLGGRKSFMGLYEKELIGRHIIAASLEYRYRFPFGFPLNFYLSIRYDVGATWKKYVEDIRSEDFIHGYGLLFSTNTPAGPISLGIGKASHRNPVLYFNAGFEF